MFAIAWLLCFQVLPDPASEEKPNRASVELSAVRQYWLPDFRGNLRVDGGNRAGSNLRLTHDLGVPDEAGIPMYGGGDISVTVRQTFSEKDRLLFSMEYWGYSWVGDKTLATSETLGNQTFPAGAYVESHFHLTSLMLDAFLAHEEKPFRLGVSIPIHVISARSRMDSLTTSSRETVRDVGWGGGVFIDVRPIPLAFAGVTAKALTSFAHAGETIEEDVRAYAGLEWGPFRLEGGYRYIHYDLALPEKDLSYVLYGPYVAFSLILRF